MVVAAYGDRVPPVERDLEGEIAAHGAEKRKSLIEVGFVPPMSARRHAAGKAPLAGGVPHFHVDVQPIARKADVLPEGMLALRLEVLDEELEAGDDVGPGGRPAECQTTAPLSKVP